MYNGVIARRERERETKHAETRRGDASRAASSEGWATLHLTRQLSRLTRGDSSSASRAKERRRHKGTENEVGCLSGLWGLLFLGGSAREILGAIGAGRCVHDRLLHAHVLRVDHAWLVGHVVGVAGVGVNGLWVGRVHHSGGGICSGGIDLARDSVSSGGHVCSSHGVVLHLGLVDSTSDGAYVVLLGVIAGDDVDEEVEDVCLLNGSGDITSLQGATFSLLGLCPCAMRKLEDEHFAGLCKEDGSFCGDHADILVGLHDLLDPGEREEMVLEIGGLLDLGHLLDPELVELCCELLQVVLLLQLGLTGLLLHELRLGGHGVVCGG